MAFYGDRTKRQDPQTIPFDSSILILKKYKVFLLTNVNIHLTRKPATPIIPLNDTENEMELPKVTIIPVQWSAELVIK